MIKEKKIMPLITSNLCFKKSKKEIGGSI